MASIDLDDVFAHVGAYWPLTDAVATNPLHSLTTLSFDDALAEARRRLGVSLTPTDNDATNTRPPTLYERVVSPRARDRARRLTGELCLQLTQRSSRGADLTERVREILRTRDSLVDLTSAEGDELRRTIASDDHLELSSWSDSEIGDEYQRHVSRLPGWAAWAAWNDSWARVEHGQGLTRSEFLRISLAMDLALLRTQHRAVLPPLAIAAPVVSLTTLRAAEDARRDDLRRRLSSSPTVGSVPRVQVVTCIDVRSEPLRRALEEFPDVETRGFAGFFGIPASVRPANRDQPYDSLPVLLDPSVSLLGGSPSTSWRSDVRQLATDVAELTHEPSAMFALAEGMGSVALPLLLARALTPLRAERDSLDESTWVAQGDELVAIADGVLTTLAIEHYGDDVIFVAHRAHSVNNAHAAALDCGACGGHGGVPNAVALAELLNRPSIRQALRARGHDIPDHTHFSAAVHDTTRGEITMIGSTRPSLTSLCHDASRRLSSFAIDTRHRSGRRRARRRSSHWAETRPEWALAGHVGILFAPRASSRGVDLDGRVFLHSYDATRDDGGAILSSLLSAPMVVAHWINAAYYFSVVAPGVFGAGDKTRHNPVGTIGVTRGGDVDLALGLPEQSLRDGTTLMHEATRLWVAIEAPLELIDRVLLVENLASQLIRGEWVRLIARRGPDAPWHERRGGHWVELPLLTEQESHAEQ